MKNKRFALLPICALGGAILVQNRTITFLGADLIGIFIAGVIGILVGSVLVVILENLFPDDGTSS